MSNLEAFTQKFADGVWGTPLVILLLGGGLFFLIISRAIPYRRLGHGVAVLMGRYDTPDAVGEISHRQALAAALSNTMGLGNIAGVALAIVAGGPGGGVLDVDLRYRRHRDEIFYLLTGRHVPGQRFSGQSTGRPDVCD